MINQNISEFIKKHITKRAESFFEKDITDNYETLKSNIEGKSVLVIGGGGTIGSSYIKSILRFKPSKVVVIDTNENGLTELVRDVRSTQGLQAPETFITYPVNFGDPIFEKIYQFYKPFDIVANFAAHKHVRSEKDIFSIESMIQNNLFYAYRLLKLIEPDQPSHFFCVSTDKAANPVNIMGASKKLMEDLVMDFSHRMKCTTARFANVAFSNGSLLDGFIHRIMNRHPLAVPGDVKRYFVSPRESGDICMLACILGQSGDIYFPKLVPDQLTKFVDITESFLTDLGYTMDRCASEAEAKEKSQQLAHNAKAYPVYVFNSETSGEKLYEEFYTDAEEIDLETYNSLGVVKNAPVLSASTHNIADGIADLENLFSSGSIQKGEIVEILSKYIPTFDHIEKGLGLDQKM